MTTPVPEKHRSKECRTIVLHIIYGGECYVKGSNIGHLRDNL